MATYDEPPGIASAGEAKKGWHWTPQTGSNPARYLINPGKVEFDKGTILKNPGNLRHVRPYISSGDNMFVWPVGAEGFRRSGRAMLGIHHYIGDNAVDVQVVHRDEARIELSGTLPGNQSPDAMIALINVLTSDPPDPGLILYMPGIFEREQYVASEDYEFDHEADDWTHSINYRVTLIRTGVGRVVSDPHGEPSKENPGESGNDKGVAARFFVVKDGLRSFKAIATRVYNDVSMWPKLVDMNQTLLREFREQRHIFIAAHELPTYRWPIGTRIKY